MNYVVGGLVGAFAAGALTFGGAQALDSTSDSGKPNSSNQIVTYTDN